MKKILVVILTLVLLFSSLSMVASARYNNEELGVLIKIDKDTDILLDGEKDEVYKNGLHIYLDRFLTNDKSGCSGQAWLVWKQGFLYAFVDIDDSEINEPDPVGEEKEPWMYDSVEFFVDAKNEGDFAYQYRIGVTGFLSVFENGKGIAYGKDQSNQYFEGATVLTDNGYTCEFKIPVEKMGVGKGIGIQFQINDIVGSRRVVIMSRDSKHASSWAVFDFDYITLADEFGEVNEVYDEFTWELENEEDEEEEEDTSSTAATTSDASSTVTDSSKPTQSDNQAGADIGEPDHDKMLTTYIIIGAAALIVIAAAVVTIIIVKKKKKSE